MRRHDLSEIDLHDGAMRIRLRRGAIVPIAPVAPLPAASAITPSAARPAADSVAEPAVTKRHLSEIKAEAPGTFYMAASPDAEPYVRIGSRVSHDTVVGQLEAMKLFTEILARCSGVIVEVVAENQQPVEHGTV